MHERITGRRAHTVAAFFHWLCSRWNRNAKTRAKQLATLEVYNIHRFTNTTGEPKREERKLIRRQWCFKEFAPTEKS